MPNLPEHPFYDLAESMYQGNPIAIAHRGGDAAGAAKENTLVQFQSASDARIWYGETDVVATKDGQPLVLHGSRSMAQQERTGQPLRASIESLTYREVCDEVRIDGEPVPHLAELLSTFPDMRFYIDPKTSAAVKPMADVINQLRAHDRVSVGAFSWGRTRAVAELLNRPTATTIAKSGSIALLGTQLKIPFLRNAIRHFGATQFSLPYKFVKREHVEMAHDLDMRLLVWTVDSELDLLDVIAKGVDGVMSNSTRLLAKLMQGKVAKLKPHIPSYWQPSSFAAAVYPGACEEFSDRTPES